MYAVKLNTARSTSIDVTGIYPLTTPPSPVAIDRLREIQNSNDIRRLSSLCFAGHTRTGTYELRKYWALSLPNARDLGLTRE
jgi:hypothetical protein